MNTQTGDATLREPLSLGNGGSPLYPPMNKEKQQTESPNLQAPARVGATEMNHGKPFHAMARLLAGPFRAR